MISQRSVTVATTDGVAAPAWTEGVNCVFAIVDVLGAFLVAPVLGPSRGFPPFVTPATSAAAVP
jgi:hypothetical protein